MRPVNKNGVETGNSNTPRRIYYKTKTLRKPYTYCPPI